MTRRRTMIALMALELALVAGAAIRYSTDGAAATIAALVLAPVAVWSVAAAGTRLGGPRFGLLTAGGYVLLPAVATAYMLGSYRSTFEHEAIPDLLGLRATPWFALGVGITLAVAYAPRVILAAVGIAAAVTALFAWGTDPLSGIRASLHETAWSITLIEWFVVAGLIGTARRSGWLAVALFGWLAAAVLHAAHGGYDNAAFWRSLAVAAPAAALMLSSLVSLVPPLRRRHAAPSPSSGPGA
jgi:hypothetical protein